MKLHSVWRALALSLGAVTAVGFYFFTRLERDTRNLFLYYFVPTLPPFVAYVCDRLEWRRLLPRRELLVDGIIVSLSLLRMILPVPFYSGHALFLTYVALNTRSTVARVLSLVVLGEVTYLKVCVWRDPTLVSGIVLAVIGAWTRVSKGITERRLRLSGRRLESRGDRESLQQFDGHSPKARIDSASG